MNASSMFAALLFGAIGCVAFRYGRKMSLGAPMMIGIFLMAYPYFVSDVLLTWVLGIGGMAALWYLRE